MTFSFHVLAAAFALVMLVPALVLMLLLVVLRRSALVLPVVVHLLRAVRVTVPLYERWEQINLSIVGINTLMVPVSAT